MNDSSALRVRFGMNGPEDLSVIEAELADEFTDLRIREGVEDVRVSPSGIGTGASGYAFEVAIEFARNLTDDATRLAFLGGSILWLVDRVRKKRPGGPMIEDGPTLGAVAAATITPTIDLDGYRFLACQPLNGILGLGTDDRYVWIAAFEHSTRGEVLAVFMSPTGTVLGQVLVPIECYSNGTDYIRRTPEDISKVFRGRNHWG